MLRDATEEFKNKANQLLNSAEESFLVLTQGGEFKSCCDEAYRCFQNIKHACGMMDLLKLQALMQELEDVLIPFKAESSMPESYVSFFLEAIGDARVLMKDIGLQFDFKYLTESLVPSDNLEGLIQNVSSQLRKIEIGTWSKETLMIISRDVQTLKDSAYLFGFFSLGDLAHAMECGFDQLPGTQILDCMNKSIQYMEEEIQCTKCKLIHDEDALKLAKLVREILDATQVENALKVA